MDLNNNNDFSLRVKELKKNPNLFDIEDITKKATGLPFPTENELFNATIATQRNVVFLGKSGVGKTTCFEVLKDPKYCTPRGHSLLASSVLETIYTPLVVHNSEGKSISLNCIDTPGLFEVRSTSDKPKRSNDDILESITNCIRGSVTNLSSVCIVFPFTNVLNQEDLHTLHAVQEFLGTSDVVKSKVFLIFSKVDSFQLENLSDRLSEFLDSDISTSFLDFCRGGIYFTGAINGESVLEYGEIYATKVKRKVDCLRQCLIDAIVASEPIPISNFKFVQNAKGTKKEGNIDTPKKETRDEHGKAATKPKK